MALIRTGGSIDSFMKAFEGKNAVMPTTGDIVITDFSGTVNKQANRPAATFPNRKLNTMTSSGDITIMIFYEDGTTAHHSGTSAFTFADKKVSAIVFGDLATSNITFT